MEKRLEDEIIGVTTKDKLLTRVLFYALGVVSAVPSNFFATASDYWLYKFRDLNSNESYNSGSKTKLQAEFTSDNAIVSNVSLLLFIIITIKFLRTRVSPFIRITVSLSTIVGMFIFTCIFVRLETDSWQTGFFVLTLIFSFIMTGFCGIFMITMFGIASKFPEGFLAIIFTGQAVCGIFTALAQIFALGLGGGPEATALVYFIIGLLFVFFALVAFLFTWRESVYFNHYMQKKVALTFGRFEFKKEVLLGAFRKSKFLMASMVITLCCSVMLYPGVLSLVSSVNENNGNKWNHTFFKPVVNFLFYNLFDFLGRELAVFYKKPFNNIYILIMSCCRIPFVPMILLCNAQPRNHLPVVFYADYAYIIFLITFAFSNGYLVNLSMLLVPEVTNDKEKPFAMVGILLLMILSLAISSVTSSALVNAL